MTTLLQQGSGSSSEDCCAELVLRAAVAFPNDEARPQGLLGSQRALPFR